MDEKSKLLVFDKKEVALIFVFMILVAVTSFTVGVKIGKDLTYKADGFVESDKKQVELKSNQEEAVDALATTSETGKAPSSDAGNAPAETVDEQLQARLKEEFQNFDKESPAAPVPSAIASPSEAKRPGAKSFIPKNEIGNYKGKYTLQLGSYANMDDAIKFADGFKVRGYSPIINEISLPGKGTWYRVSLGIFDSVAQAKTYIQKEESLFQGQDYVITELK